MGIKPFKISCNTIVSTYLNKCKQCNRDEKELIYNITYNSYKIMQNKFVEYFNDSRPRKYNLCHNPTINSKFSKMFNVYLQVPNCLKNHWCQ